MRSQLAVAGRDMPVLVPPMYGDEFSAPGAAERLRGWWDAQRTGVELTAATLLIVDVEELAGLGRIAYVAVQPGMPRARSYGRDAAVIEVPAGTVRDLVDAVVSRTAGAGDRGGPSETRRPVSSLRRPEQDSKPLWDGRLARTAMVTGALGVGAWLLSSAFAPGQAQAASVQEQQQAQQQQQLQQYDDFGDQAQAPTSSPEQRGVESPFSGRRSKRSESAS